MGGCFPSSNESHVQCGEFFQVFTPEWLAVVSSPSWYGSAGCSQKHFCELFCILSDICFRVRVMGL